MEEKVGEIWHRIITHVAQDHYPEAAVILTQMNHTLNLFFRALGGDGGLRVEAAEGTEQAARRRWLQRIAGVATKVELAWRDERSLRLPEHIDYFSDPALNRALYLWLAALAAADGGGREPWLQRNQRLTGQVLERWPGLARRYRELVAEHLEARPDPRRMSPAEAVQERVVRQALEQPGSVAQLPAARRAPWPVPLWLHPSPPGAAGGEAAGDDDADAVGGRSKELEEPRRRHAERTEMPKKDQGLVTIRMENIFTWGEHAKVDRGTDEDDDLEAAADAAKEMETIAVARDDKSIAGRLRFDLDLPSEACDDQILGEGILLPEWDWKRAALVREHCRIVPMQATDAESCELPLHLKRTARRLRAQFEQLRPARQWLRAQPDGSEIDVDAYLRFSADRAAGCVSAGNALYLDLRSGARDLACLLLADLSLSTDTYVDNKHRVIDVIRDSLYLFAESLAATGDRFALYGFSSRKRDPVRFHSIKSFDKPYDGAVRGRIGAVKPGYYTRMGAAIRYARILLEQQPAKRRLLLLISDGKPNDLDKYEGRYGIEDTRRAVREALTAGLQPFCVTVDEKGSDYLPYLFGSGGYLVIQKPRELPRKLPVLYARLTR